jgi:tetratricopeptide (TPR) repeat protein
VGHTIETWEGRQVTAARAGRSGACFQGHPRGLGPHRGRIAGQLVSESDAVGAGVRWVLPHAQRLRTKAETYVFLGRYDRATEQLRRSIAMNPQIPLTHFMLAAALALTGRMTEAAEARDAGLVLDPNFSVARYCKDPRSDNPVFLQQRERMYKGLRKADVPEGR